MEPPKAASIFWANILERDGWLLISVDNKKLGIIISVTEAGQQHLRIAGFHLGESMFIGERRNVLSVRVERIPESQQKEMLPKIHESLPPELRGLPVAFL
jgi:hypothetical protein